MIGKLVLKVNTGNKARKMCKENKNQESVDDG